MEVAEIAALYGENALVLSGHQASETSLKLLCSNADTIHIASHAFVNDDSMELSGILMAQDDENDGMLQLFEIMQLKLDSACVVLSACNTSKGSSFWGEGMVGFAHAFFFAGARSLVLSWWPVQDRSTAELMRQFHREYASTFDAAHALRQAACSLKGDPKTAHPYYWAPFMVLGDAMPPESPP